MVSELDLSIVDAKLWLRRILIHLYILLEEVVGISMSSLEGDWCLVRLVGILSFSSFTLP